MDASTIFIIQFIIWVITIVTTIFILYWTVLTCKKRQFWNITIPQLFYLINQLLFYSCVLWSRYVGVPLNELFGAPNGMSELWSAILRLQGTVTLLAMAFIVKSYLKGIEYDSINSRRID